MRKSELSKLKAMILSAVLFLCLPLIGCAAFTGNMEDAGAKEQSAEVIPDSGIEEPFENETTIDKTEGRDDEEIRASIGLNPEEVQNLIEAQRGNYNFEQLNSEEQVVYTEIFQIIKQRENDVRISSMDTKIIDRVFQCVLNDHPELFYIDGYTYTKYTLGEELKKITFTGTYPIDREETDRREKKIEAYADMCISGIPPETDEYGKVKYIYEYLINNTEYDAGAADNQNICSVFLNGKSVCQGYAKSMQYLLKKCGIFSTLVIGRVSNGEGHAWNLVRIDGDYYYVDPTWGDASYQMVEGTAREENGEKYEEGHIPTINYDYLCVTTNQLEKTHTIENTVELPECVSMDANYYVREGAYFTSLEEDKIKSLFEKEYERGGSYVTLKCSDDTVYSEMESVLIQEQEIFKYLNSPDGVIAYSDNPEQLSLSFWL